MTGYEKFCKNVFIGTIVFGVFAVGALIYRIVVIFINDVTLGSIISLVVFCTFLTFFIKGEKVIKQQEQ